ncbi:MAG: hypothetical protein V4712_03065 [Pseudomonadota bacterium]
MFKSAVFGLSLAAALLAGPVLAQTEPAPPAPAAGEAAPPSPPPPPAPGDPKPMGHKPGGGPDDMMPPPAPKTSIKIALGKDQMLEIDCGATEIGACVAAAKPLLDRFLD